MKKIGVLAVVLATAFLFVGVASAEMYVEGYLGGAMTGSMNGGFTAANVTNGTVGNTSQANATFGKFNAQNPGAIVGGRSLYNFNHSGSVEPAVLGGIKIGTWFVKEGTLGWSGYPDWAKYFGFYTDFSYQRLYTRDNSVTGTDTFLGLNPANNGKITDVGFMKTEGMAATWAFMLVGRYGFFQDSEVPFGRLQPYVAAGPAIMFTSLKPKIWTQSRQIGDGTDLTYSPGNQSSTNIALAVDAGVRYMALKNVSFDISFKYRYAQPTFEFTGQDGSNSAATVMKLNPNVNLFSFQAGVAYHF